MGSKTVTFDGAASFKGRAFASGDGYSLARAAARSVASGLVNSVGAIVFVAVLILAVTFAAAWIVRTGLVTNGQTYTTARSGPGTLALGYDPAATEAAQPGSTSHRPPVKTAAEFYARYVVDVPQGGVRSKIAHASAPVQTARVGRVPIPRVRPHIPQPEVAAQIVPKVSPQGSPQVARMPEPEPIAKVTAAIPTTPPAAIEKRAAPPDAHNKAAVNPEAGARTAVYDIAAHTVYLPNGEKLEAHSGLYEKMDDPRYINVRMRGPTPPNVYDLSLREQLFHGVRAIRLNPVDESKMHGRDGMLAHTYMLGPNGQSNGCVSFKDYSKFLQAFLDGKVDRLVVVPELGTTSWRTAAASGGVRTGPVRRYASSMSRYDDEPEFTGALGYAPDRGAGNW